MSIKISVLNSSRKVKRVCQYLCIKMNAFKNINSRGQLRNLKKIFARYQIAFDMRSPWRNLYHLFKQEESHFVEFECSLAISRKIMILQHYLDYGKFNSHFYICPILSQSILIFSHTYDNVLWVTSIADTSVQKRLKHFRLPDPCKIFISHFS
jgi:hypothetical protein